MLFRSKKKKKKKRTEKKRGDVKADGGVKWINSNIIKHKKELKKKVTWKLVELAEASVIYIYIYIYR